MNTPTTLYYKVGRTDNVPRRIGEWSSRKLMASVALSSSFLQDVDIPPLRFETSSP